MSAIMRHFINSALPAFTNDAVLRAQVKIVKTQMPLIFGCLFVNLLVVSAAFFYTAPMYLTVIIPGILLVAITYRMIYWRKKVFSENSFNYDVTLEFEKSTILIWVLTFLVGCWSVALLQYANLSQMVLMICFVWINSANIIVGLAYLPKVHKGMLLLASALLSYILIITGEPIIWSSIVLFTTFSLIFIRLLNQHYRSFVDAESSKIELKQQIEQTNLVKQQMEKLALTDALTDLPNRRAFATEIENRIKSAKDDEKFAVGVIDLDGFKPVNDVFGHACGDSVLIEVGKRITAVLGDNGMVARLGGDEFGLFFPKLSNKKELLKIGEKMATCLRQPYQYEMAKAMLSGSCGIAIYPDNGKSLETLLENADRALYKIKKSHNVEVEICSADNDDSLTIEARLEQALRLAIATNSIYLEYQPIVNLSNGQIVAFEALARWTDPAFGNVPCEKFIAMSERTGLINELSNQLLVKAFADAVCWPGDVGLSINISAVQIARPEFGLSFIATLSKYDLLPSRIQIEITETALMSNFDIARKNIDDFRAAGVQVALDDFGSGFAGFGYLDKIVVDKLKIDSSFVPSTNMSNGKRQIQKSIVGLSTGLDIITIQVGIENEEQHDQAMKTGCKFGQGYLYSKSMRADEILSYMADQIGDGSIENAS